MSSVSEIQGTSSFSLSESLKELQSSHQSSFIVLGHEFNKHSPSIGLRIDNASLVVNAKGSLEDDGGFDGLRQILNARQDLQFVFFKFCSKLILVQLIPEHITAVQRARSMVFGRSLAAQIPISNHSSKISIVTINTPSQLTDPFLRSQLALGTNFGQSKFLPRSITQSSSISRHFLDTTQDRSPDVPTSVSSATLQSSPFPQSTSLSTIDTSSSNSHSTQISFTGLPAVGLGIGGMGRDAISPFRETFDDPSTSYYRTMVEDDEEKRRISNSTVMPIKRLNNSFDIGSSPPFIHDRNTMMMRRESSVGDSESELEDGLRPQFPDPPKRNSQMSTMSGKLAAPRKSVGQLSNSMSTTSAWIDSYEQRSSFDQKMQSPIKQSGSDSLFTLSKTSVFDPESSVDSGNFSKKAIHSRSVRHAPSLPSMLSSFSHGSSSVQQGGVNGRTHHGPSVELKNNQSSGIRPISISNSSVMTHESVFAELQNGRDLIFVDENDESSYTVEQLEKERLDFLRWKEEQERIILAKEVQRERQRRILDEAKREHVMRRLLKEQCLTDQNLTAAMEDEERGNKIGEVKPQSKAIRPIKSKSTLSTNSQSDEYKMDTKSGTSTKTRSKRSHTTGTRSTQSPLHPPPPLPLPKSPSDSLPKRRKEKMSEETVDDIAAIFARQSKIQSEQDGMENLKVPNKDEKDMTNSSESDPIGRLIQDKKIRQRTSPPLADSVKAAIEREMRRPVITLEGHVRPRVRQLRSQTYSNGQKTSNLRSAVDGTVPFLSADRDDDITKSPLIKSMIEAKEKAQLFGNQNVGNKNDDSDHSDFDSFDEVIEKAKPFTFQNATSTPALIKIVDPDGKGVGSGWALSEVKGMQVGNPVDKDLPVTPRASTSLSTNSLAPSLLNLSEMVGFTIDTFDEEKDSSDNVLSGKPEMQSYESEVDFADHNNARQQQEPVSTIPVPTRSATDPSSGREIIRSNSDSPKNDTHLENDRSPDRMRKPMENLTQSQTILSLPQTNSMTLIDQIFRSKLSASKPEAEIPQRITESNTDTGLTNEQFNAILARQNQLDKLLTDLQRKRTITKEVEGAARARWARQQVERQRLDAYERSLLESEERLRRAKTDNLVSQEEEKQRQLEDEHAAVERRIIEEEERRKIVARQNEVRNEKLRIAHEMQKQLHQEIEGMQQSRHQRRLQLFSEMKEKISSKDCSFLNGSVTIQFGSGQKFRRAHFELYNDHLDLYNQSRDESSKKLIESIKVTQGSILQISEAFEEVQVPHAFSIHLAPVAHSGKLGETKEPIIAYTDNEHSKERLMAGLSVLSGLEAI